MNGEIINQVAYETLLKAQEVDKKIQAVTNERAQLKAELFTLKSYETLRELELRERIVGLNVLQELLETDSKTLKEIVSRIYKAQ